MYLGSEQILLSNGDPGYILLGSDLGIRLRDPRTCLHTSIYGTHSPTISLRYVYHLLGARRGLW